MIMAVRQTFTCYYISFGWRCWPILYNILKWLNVILIIAGNCLRFRTYCSRVFLSVRCSSAIWKSEMKGKEAMATRALTHERQQRERLEALDRVGYIMAAS